MRAISGSWARLLGHFAKNGLRATRRCPILVEELERRLSPSISPAVYYSIRGDYVAAGVGMQGRSTGNLNLSGVPSNTTVVHAFLYWGGGSSTFSFQDTAVTGTLLGSGNWGPGYRYELPTGLVTGDGAYSIAGFSGDGVSLVVVYEFTDTRYPLKDVFIDEGYQDFVTGVYTPSSTTFSFSSPAPARVSATTTFIGGEGDNNKYESESFDSYPSGGHIAWSNLFSQTNGGKWDTITKTVSSQVRAGDTAATATVKRDASGNDLFYWVAQVFSIGAPAIIITESSGSTSVTENGNTDTYTVVLATRPEYPVFVSVNADAQLTVSPTSLTFTGTSWFFTPANWWIPQTVTVTARDDLFAQGDRAVQITHAASSIDPSYDAITVDNVDVTIIDNDTSGVTLTLTGGSIDVAEAGTSDTFTAVLTSIPQEEVTITLTPGQHLSVNPTKVIFTSSNWNSPQTVTVSSIDNQIDDSNSTYTDSISISVVSTDSDYNLSGSLTATITDNDVADVTIAPSVLSLAEGGASKSYTVTLTSEPTSAVTVVVHPGTQLTATPSSLVFTASNWLVSQTVTVTAVDDKTIEGTQTPTITHSITGDDTIYANLVLPSVDTTLTDNDFPGLTVNPTSLSMLEGKTQSYSVSLDTAPTADVTVTVTFTYDTLQLTLSPASLEFTANNWNKPQPVTAMSYGNAIEDGNRSTLITNDFASPDPRFIGVPLAPTTVNIIDDENSIIVKGTDGVDKNNLLFSFVSNLIQVTINGKATFYPRTTSQILAIPGSGANTVRLANPTVPVTVLGGKGNDTVTIDGASTSNTFLADGSVVMVNGNPVSLFNVERVVLVGKQNNDVFQVDSMPPFALTFQGGGRSDTVVGPNQPNAWKVTGANAGTLNATVSYNSVINLTGGSGDETFVFGSGKAIGGVVDGGGGNDTLDFSASKAAITADLGKGIVTSTKGFRNIETIIGGAGSDKLIGSETTSTWNIIGPNAGNVNGLGFQGFENLTGGSLLDDFVFAVGASVKGKIDGRGGSNSLDFGSFSANMVVNLQTRSATNTGGWLNIGSFSGGAGTNALVGANKTNSWVLTGTNNGQVGGIAFQDFGNLIGGTLSDQFDVTADQYWTGLLDGGAGIDTILSRPGSAYVRSGPASGTLNGHAFKNVEKWL